MKEHAGIVAEAIDVGRTEAPVRERSAPARLPASLQALATAKGRRRARRKAMREWVAANGPLPTGPVEAMPGLWLNMPTKEGK